MNRFEWTSAAGFAEAASSGCVTVAQAMRTQSGVPGTGAAVFKAGGIDLLGLMKGGLLTPRRVVNLRAVPELAHIAEASDRTLRIGALVTLEQLAADPLVRGRYRAVALAADSSASPQIRHVATIGGNLLQRPRCWYFQSLHHHCVRKGGRGCFAFAGENQYHAIFDHDGCAIVHPSTVATALVAFSARVELASAGGNKRVVPLDEFFVLPRQDVERENDLRPGELLTTLMLPPVPGMRSSHLRQGELESFDWPIADVAVVLDLGPGDVCRAASVVLGAAAPVPRRARQAEKALAGRRVNEEAARAAARAAVAGAMPLSKNAYKIPIFETLVHRVVLDAARPV